MSTHTPGRSTPRPGSSARRSPPAAARMLSIALALIAGTTGPIAAQSDPLHDEWRWSRFTSVSGAPMGRVRDITSTTEGVAWAFTTQELVWFDGYRWQPATGAPPNRVERLTADTDGGVIVVSSGSVWRGDETGLTELILEHDGDAVAVRQAVPFGGANGLLILSDTDMYRYDGRELIPFPPPADGEGLANGWLVRTEVGGTWFVSTWESVGALEWSGEAWVRRLPYRTAKVHQSEVGGVFAVNHLTSLNGLWAWEGEDGMPERLAGEDAGLVSALAGSSGDVVAAYRSGRVRVRRSDGWRWLDPVPRDLSTVDALHFDAAGDLWVGTDRGLALHRASSSLWTRWSPDTPTGPHEVNALATGPDGELWIGTNRGLYVRSADGDTEYIPEIQGQALGVVTGVTRGPDGSMWVSSGADWEGAFRWRDGSWERVGEAQGLRARQVHRIEVDRQGRLWFLGLSNQPGVDQPGAYVYDGATFTRWGEPEGLPSGRVYAFEQAPDGSLWFGTARALSRWSDGEWTHWTVSSGLTRARVYTLAVADGRTWFGHMELGGGLGFVDQDGNVGYVLEADGLVDERVTNIQPVRDGSIWIGTAGGVARYTEGRFATFDRSTGLEHPRVWPVLPASDRVFIGTSGGGVYELHFDATEMHPPRVAVDPPSVHDGRVSVEWTALAYRGEIAPEAIETRFRVDGGPWSEWSRAREVTLEAESGGHVVEVEAKGLFGELSPAPAMAVFQVPPPLVLHPLVLTGLLIWLTTGIAVIGVQARRRRQQLGLIESSERRLRRMVEQMPICIHEIGLDGRLLSMNPAGLAMMGLERESEIVGAPYLSAVAEEDRAHVAELIERVRSGETCDFQFQAEMSDGSTKIFASSLVPLRDEDGAIVKLMGYTQDLTERVSAEDERQRLEETLRQVQKMEAVGQLAGGVAHDFNNLLTVIGGFASLLEGKTGNPEAVREILDAHDRASALTRKLLAFGRRQVLDPRVVDIGESVRGLEGMLRRLIVADVTLRFDIADDVGCAEVDPAAIEQVVINLVVNARDAVAPGGTIRVSAFDETLEAPRRTPNGVVDPGDYVVIRVTDDGVGMDEETRARAFEPFFTTKPPGRGTGLGLATTYGIVTESGGLVELESEPGRGTRFSVYLPRVAAEPTEQVTREVERDTELDGSETVLVAEDDCAVGEFVASTLRRYGYTVLTARDGAEAADLVETYPGSIDALVTDLIMPELNGPELAERFRGVRPRGTVLYMSGYADASRLGGGSEPAVDLNKPFRADELARQLRVRLDERPEVLEKGA